MKNFHIVLLILSILLALYELLLIIIYHDISLSKLVFILAIIIVVYSYCYLHYSIPKLLTGLILVVIASFITIEGCVLYYSFDHSTHDYDTILILGAQVRGEHPSPALAYRIEKAAEYLATHPDTLVIASGGQGYNENKTEAKCIADELAKYGDYNIILEENSTSTEENLEFSKQYFTGKVAMVSNSFHLFRAHLIASKQGLDIDLIPSGNHLITYPHFLIREYFGVLSLLL